VSTSGTYATVRFDHNKKIKSDRLVKTYSISLCSKSEAPLTLFVNRSLNGFIHQVKRIRFILAKKKHMAQREMNEENKSQKTLS